jgi:hypothetical protein
VSKIPTTRKGRIVKLLVLFVASVIVVDGLVGDRGLLAMLRARHSRSTGRVDRASAGRERAAARTGDACARIRQPDQKRLQGASSGLIKPGSARLHREEREGAQRRHSAGGRSGSGQIRRASPARDTVRRSAEHQYHLITSHR